MPMDVKQRLMDDSFNRGLDLFGKTPLGRQVVDIGEENTEVNKLLKKASAKKRKTGEVRQLCTLLLLARVLRMTLTCPSLAGGRCPAVQAAEDPPFRWR